MKNKLLIFLLLLSCVAFQGSAKFTIILKNGGQNNKYNYVYLDKNHCECKGAGQITCPINFGSMSGVTRSIYHPLGNVIDYVMREVRNGKSTGSILFENDLPVSWSLPDPDNVAIEIDQTDTKGLEKYYDKK
jgi:hypothetical protein